MFAPRDLYRRPERRKNRRPHTARHRNRRPMIEELEPLVLMAIVTTVNNTMDMGQGSLRQAIMDVNTNQGGTINFALPGGGGTIVTAGLPTITSKVIINGPTQNNSPLVTISGNGNAGVNGLTLGQGSDGSTVLGLFITNFTGNGLVINSANDTIGAGNVISGNQRTGIAITGSGATGNTVKSNFIGTDATGMKAVPNGGEGIDISGGATGNTIGGLTADARNIISGNNKNNTSDGIDIFDSGTSNNLVEGNYIGVAKDGTTRLGNGESGVYIYGGATTNTIGGTQAGARNVISGNAQDGIDIHDQGTTGNLVQGNFIGVDSTGIAAEGNGVDGVDIDNAAMNTVGGAVAEARNIIAGNGVIGSADPGDGVEIVDPGATGNLVAGNYIGVGVNGTAVLDPTTGNNLLRNAGYGVNIFSGAATTTVGGAGAAANVISGNIGGGVAIHDMGSNSNTVVNNTIGLDTRGAAAPNGGAGVEIFNGAATNLIGPFGGAPGNLISGNTGAGISIHDTGSSRNIVIGDTIGVNVSGGGAGAVARPNGGAGVEIFNGAASNTIGGAGASANLISGNSGAGVSIHDTGTTSNTVIGDTIGLNITGGGAGSVALANGGAGVEIYNGASMNIIGGTQAGAGDVIAGNTGDGVSIHDAKTADNTVEGDTIGLNAAGAATPNTGIAGVEIFKGADDNTIGGAQMGEGDLISGNTADGVSIHDAGTTGNTVEGDTIGLNAAGAATPNGGAAGVEVFGGAATNTIGGTQKGEGNLISGNFINGIDIHDSNTSGNKVEGNRIGTDVNGTAAVANRIGIEVYNAASGNTIGGTESGAGNLISGNRTDGVSIHDPSTTGNTVEGNRIGTNLSGSGALANNDGVEIASGASGNTIGGTEAGAGNLISGNTRFGIFIHDTGTTGNHVEGNFIGTDVTGTVVLGDALGVEVFNGASNNAIGGTEAGAGNLISGNGNIYGLYIYGTGTTGNTAEGNRIGTDVTGTVALANGIGVYIALGASGNTIGGTEAGAGNLISGNGGGIYIFGYGTGTTGNRVEGNFIGTDATGTVALGNAVGVEILSASGNTIGGTEPGASNLISGNGEGIVLYDVGTIGNTVEGNRIGTDVTGTVALANGIGVEILNGASGNTIGGTEAGAGNLISGNQGNIAYGGDGIVIHDAGTTGNKVEGNFIGTDASGTVALGNASYGVEVANGATDNDIGGTEAGARNVISGNLFAGVAIHGAGTARDNVEGDYIGTEVSGTAALANLIGVTIFDAASGNDVGGTMTGAGNLISGNISAGVAISGPNTLGNRIEENYIGTTASGLAALGNANFGVEIYDGASANDVGGTMVGAGNLISGNGGWGVGIYDLGTTGNKVEGDFIGINASGLAALGNVAGGVEVANGATDNDIGGTEAGARNVISGNQGDGISIHGSGTTGNLVEGNMVGTDSGGILALGNGANGVEVYAGAADNTIGGTEAGARNLISDNGIAHSGSDENDNGIIIHDANTTGNKVEGNYIGTNVTSTTGLGNFGSGVRIDGGASDNDVGGTDAGAGNIISSNGQAGITISGQNTTGNKVEGNFIGTDATGTVAVGNNGDGVAVVNSASSNTIGGTDTGAGNTIAFNGGNGVTIGTSTDDQATGNGILGNAIFSNTLLGIDLADDGVTPNSPGGPHSGPNDLQNYPVLTSATSDSTSTTIAGTFNSTPDTTFRIEFFSNPAADPSGYGQGQTYLGSVSVTTDDDGNATFSTTLATAVPAGQVVTATATDPDNNTSEFALDLAVTSGSP